MTIDDTLKTRRRRLRTDGTVTFGQLLIEFLMEYAAVAMRKFKITIRAINVSEKFLKDPAYNTFWQELLLNRYALSLSPPNESLLKLQKGPRYLE